MSPRMLAATVGGPELSQKVAAFGVGVVCVFHTLHGLLGRSIGKEQQWLSASGVEDDTPDVAGFECSKHLIFRASPLGSIFGWAARAAHSDASGGWAVLISDRTQYAAGKMGLSRGHCVHSMPVGLSTDSDSKRFQKLPSVGGPHWAKAQAGNTESAARKQIGRSKEGCRNYEG